MSAMVFADAFPLAHLRTPAPLEVLSMTGPAGLAKVASDLVAFTIIDSYLAAAEEYGPTALYGTPMHSYEWRIKNGAWVLERIVMRGGRAMALDTMA